MNKELLTFIKEILFEFVVLVHDLIYSTGRTYGRFIFETLVWMNNNRKELGEFYAELEEKFVDTIMYAFELSHEGGIEDKATIKRWLRVIFRRTRFSINKYNKPESMHEVYSRFLIYMEGLIKALSQDNEAKKHLMDYYEVLRLIGFVIFYESDYEPYYGKNPIGDIFFKYYYRE